MRAHPFTAALAALTLVACAGDSGTANLPSAARPPLKAIALQVIDGDVWLQWEPHPGAQRYDLARTAEPPAASPRSGIGMRSPMVRSASGAPAGGKIIGTPAVATYRDPVSTAATYGYQVRIVRDDGTPGPWAPLGTLTVAPKRLRLPAAPAALAAERTGDGVRLQWLDRADNERRYQVERAPEGGALMTKAVLPPGTQEYVDAAAPQDLALRYRVRALNDAGAAASDEVYVAAGGAPAKVPEAPAFLFAAARASYVIELTWTDASANETAFRIERRTAATAFATVAVVPAGTTYYRDETLAAGTQYLYRVTAVNTAGESAPSNQAAAETPAGTGEAPRAPAGLGVTGVGPDRVRVAWLDRSSNEDGFVLERRVGAGAFHRVGAFAAGTTAYVDRGLPPSTAITYRIAAHNDGLLSAFSSEVTGPTLCGRQARETHYDYAGDDGAWYTADDRTVYQRTLIQTSAGTWADMEADQAGLDGVWGTLDDLLRRWTATQRTPAGEAAEMLVFHGVGSDGRWRTSDDWAYSRREADYTPEGRAIELRVSSAGNDAAWGTYDDEFSRTRYTWSGTYVTGYYGETWNLGGPGTWQRTWDTLEQPSGRVVDFARIDVYAESVRFERRTFAYDATGNALIETVFDGPGADMMYATADDDPPRHRVVRSVDAQGRLTSEIQIVPGTDGVFDTSDDGVADELTVSYTPAEERTVRRSGGFDGLINGAGDVVVLDAAVWRNAAGDVTGEVRNERHSPSGLPLQGVHYTKVYHPTGNVLGRLMDWKDYSGPGPDGLFGTADDVLTYHEEYEYFSAATGTDLVVRGFDRESGLLLGAYREVTLVNAVGATKWVAYPGPGSDGLWRSADDLVAAYQGWTYDGVGRLLTRTAYEGAGDDMVWFTSDDTIGERDAYAHVPGGETLWRYQGPGVNGTWGDDDDNLTFYRKQVNTEFASAEVWAQYDYLGTFYFGYRFETERDASDRITRLGVWGDPGGDGLWETPDDVAAHLAAYTYDSLGRTTEEYEFEAYDATERFTTYAYAGDLLVEQRDYRDPGYDAEWGTHDDHLGAYRTWHAVDTCAP